MYTISKNPSKIITKMRRTLVQNDEPFDSIKDMQQRTLFVIKPTRIYKSPKPVFRNFKNQQQQLQQRTKQPVITFKEYTKLDPEHEKLIHFIEDSWNKMILIEYNASVTGVDASTSADPSLQPNCVRHIIEEKDLDKKLAHFKPFDLEAFWMQRIFDHIIKDS